MKDYTITPNDVYRTILTSKEVNRANCIALYHTLFFTRNFKTDKCHISYNKIVDLLGWGNSRISNTIKELENLKLIKYDRGNELIHKTNTFTFPLFEKIKDDSEVKPTNPTKEVKSTKEVEPVSKEAESSEQTESTETVELGIFKCKGGKA